MTVRLLLGIELESPDEHFQSTLIQAFPSSLPVPPNCDSVTRLLISKGNKKLFLPLGNLRLMERDRHFK